MKHPDELSLDQAREIVRKIRDLLWLDLLHDKESLNPDKEWDSETLDSVAEVMTEAGLRPDDELELPEDEHNEL